MAKYTSILKTSFLCCLLTSCTISEDPIKVGNCYRELGEDNVLCVLTLTELNAEVAVLNQEGRKVVVERAQLKQNAVKIECPL